MRYIRFAALGDAELGDPHILNRRIHALAEGGNGMRRTILAAVVVAAAAGLTVTHDASHASAAAAAGGAPSAAGGARTAAVCKNDGTATLCASTFPSQDATAINYQVTQQDGPGSYSVFYTNLTSGVSSPLRSVGPLGYQNVTSGVMYAAIQRCYNVTLSGNSGTPIVVGPVCG